MKPIVSAPNSVLTTQSQTVTSFDKKLAKLITEMKQTLNATRNPKGVGLAAPQIGASWRVFIIRPKESDPIRIFINPEIVSYSQDKTDGVPERDKKLEGCLSIPKLWGKVKRSSSLRLRYQDETGQTKEENFKGFVATIIQHETDHTNGILFTQRILEQKGKFYKPELDETGKETLTEIGLP